MRAVAERRRASGTSPSRKAKERYNPAALRVAAQKPAPVLTVQPSLNSALGGPDAGKAAFVVGIGRENLDAMRSGRRLRGQLISNKRLVSNRDLGSREAMVHRLREETSSAHQRDGEGGAKDAPERRDSGDEDEDDDDEDDDDDDDGDEEDEDEGGDDDRSLASSHVSRSRRRRSSRFRQRPVNKEALSQVFTGARLWRPPNVVDALAMAEERHVRDRDVVTHELRTFPVCGTAMGRHCVVCVGVDPCREGNKSSFAYLGPGVTNYFKFLKWGMGLFTLLSLGALPFIVVLVSAASSDAPSGVLGLMRWLVVSTCVGNVDVVGGSDLQLFGGSVTMSQKALSLLAGLSDIAMCVILLFGILWLRTGERQEASDVETTIITADDYTVQFHGIPGDTSADDFARFLIGTLPGHDVHAIVVVEDHSVLLQAFMKHVKLVAKLEQLDVELSLQLALFASAVSDVVTAHSAAMTPPTPVSVRTIDDAAAPTSPGVEATGGAGSTGGGRAASAGAEPGVGAATWQPSHDGTASTAPHPQAPPALAKRIQKLRQRRDDVVERLRLWGVDLAKSKPQNRTLSVFVTFRQRSGYWAALKKWPGRRTTLKWLLMRSSLRFGDKYRLTVSTAPKPSTLQWQNMGYSWASRLWRRTVTLSVSALLLLLACVLIYASREVSESGTAGATYPCASGRCPCERDPTNAECLVSGIGGLLTVFTPIILFGINVALNAVTRALSGFEKHADLNSMEVTVFDRLLERQFINTALITLVFNIKFDVPIVEEVIGRGKFGDFTREWYHQVGVNIVLTVFVLAVAPAVTCVLKYARHILSRWFFTRVWLPSSQRELNERLLGPPLRLSERYSRVLNIVFVGLLLSAGMPILLPLIALAFVVTYWTEKFLLLRVYQTPPQFDVALGFRATGLIVWALALHLVVGVWMLSAPMFNSEALVSQSDVHDLYVVSRGAATAFVRGMRAHTTGMTVLFLLLVGGGILVRLVHVLVGLFHLITCGACRSAEAHVGASPPPPRRMRSDAFAASVRELAIVGSGGETHVHHREFPPFPQAVTTGVLKGLHSYDILDNPAFGFALMFNTAQREIIREEGLGSATMFLSSMHTPSMRALRRASWQNEEARTMHGQPLNSAGIAEEGDAALLSERDRSGTRGDPPDAGAAGAVESTPATGQVKVSAPAESEPFLPAGRGVLERRRPQRRQ